MFNRRKLLVLSFTFVAIGYLFSIATTSLSIIVLIIAWLLNYKDHNYKNIIREKKLLFPVLYIIITMISLSYSLDYASGLTDVTRQISFLLLPFIFLTVKPLDELEIIKIKRVYIYAVLVLFIISLGVAIVRQIGSYGRGGDFNWWYFYRYDFLEVFQQHPTFVTLYTIVAISFLLFQGKKLITNIKMRLFIIFFLSLGIVLCGSRIGYAISLLVAFVYVIIDLREKDRGQRKKFFLIYSLSSLAFLYAMWSVPIIKERVLYSLGYQYDYKYNPHADVSKGSAIQQGRLLLWEDALFLIKERPIFGYGTGSDRLVLRQKYKKEGHATFLKENYNAHSTYLELELIGGIFLVGSFLLMMYIVFVESYRKKDILLFIFVMIITITAITEYVFGRVQGVVFFLFFYYFLSVNQISRISFNKYKYGNS